MCHPRMPPNRYLSRFGEVSYAETAGQGCPVAGDLPGLEPGDGSAFSEGTFAGRNSLGLGRYD